MVVTRQQQADTMRGHAEAFEGHCRAFYFDQQVRQSRQQRYWHLPLACTRSAQGATVRAREHVPLGCSCGGMR